MTEPVEPVLPPPALTVPEAFGDLAALAPFRGRGGLEGFGASEGSGGLGDSDGAPASDGSERFARPGSFGGSFGGSEDSGGFVPCEGPEDFVARGDFEDFVGTVRGDSDGSVACGDSADLTGTAGFDAREDPDDFLARGDPDDSVGTAGFDGLAGPVRPAGPGGLAGSWVLPDPEVLPEPEVLPGSSACGLTRRPSLRARRGSGREMCRRVCVWAGGRRRGRAR